MNSHQLAIATYGRRLWVMDSGRIIHHEDKPMVETALYRFPRVTVRGGSGHSTSSLRQPSLRFDPSSPPVLRQLVIFSNPEETSILQQVCFGVRFRHDARAPRLPICCGSLSRLG